MISVATTRVRPTHGRFGGLVWTLIRTDFKTRYHGTIGGFAWALLKPLTMFLVLLAVFLYVFASDPQYKLELDHRPVPLRVLPGSNQVRAALAPGQGIPAHQGALPDLDRRGHVGLERGDHAGAVLGRPARVPWRLVGRHRQSPSRCTRCTWAYFLAIVAGFSLAASVLFMRYRDLNQVWDVITQAGFFIAPIIYPLGILPERVHAYLYAWPPTPIILFSRSVLVDGRIPSPLAHLLLLIETAVVLGAGLLIYRARVSRVAEEL